MSGSGTGQGRETAAAARVAGEQSVEQPAVEQPAVEQHAVEERAAENRAVEIRSYALRPGTRAEFHRLMSEQAVPMLRRWQVDVVAHGPSPHDADSYCLIRAYRDLGERQASQDAFYGSDEWRSGPREAILAHIESFTSVVLLLDGAAIDALRDALPG